MDEQLVEEMHAGPEQIFGKRFFFISIPYFDADLLFFSIESF